MRAAADAGMSRAQINDALQHARVTVKTGHSVVYPGQGSRQDFGAALAGVRPQPAFPADARLAGQAWSRPQRPQRKLRGANRFGAIVGVVGGAIGLCVGGAAAVTTVFPSSALWMSGIVCRSPYHLAYNTSHYSYRPGQSGTSASFQCVSSESSYNVNDFVLMGLQSLLAAFVLCVVLGVGVLMRRLLRKPG